MSNKGLRMLGVAVAIVLAGVVRAAGAQAGPAPLPVDYSTLVALADSIRYPGSEPPGVNDWSCRSAKHPEPVVLVHGTHANMRVNWNALAPLLKNDGYCVFALNFGGLKFGQIGGTGDIRDSVGELDRFVDRVRAATGATVVDLVGHSQGGPLIRYYTSVVGGASKVHDVVALAPTYRGSDALGLDPWVAMWRTALPGLAAALDELDTAAMQQFRSSEFNTALAGLPDTVPGLRYTTIVSRYDIVATPMTDQFLHGPEARNIVVQDVCPNDFTDHLAMAYDRVALQEILNGLDPEHAVRPPCEQMVLPYFGG
ncbi:esterase/lipase family protein [Nocardia vulneris]|uniref:AB hydrolase-1 domain-containing protein n=1 Tax=Nocardia vulneris TaxID=1141657 RepID=A0ABR4ZEP1_9NOCA|nr:alpha/beta fold hydrolase [Nocardia vulneris]KIA63659.1 hypothetical protein FG87_17710 [Nocardia vulneris]